MKVLLINGSPHEKGCTYTALQEVSGALEANGIEAEMVWLGAAPIGGCTGCKACRVDGGCNCVFNTPEMDTLFEKAEEADGIVIGAPVHFAAPGANACAFLDRLFYSTSAKLRYKPGACVVSCRRGGASSSFDRLNKYFTINRMPVVSSQYWNSVHGNTPEEVLQDKEGLQTMRTLGNDMAWLLKCIEAGKTAGINPPELEPKITTNFIR